ncbi:MAG TPA: hypothetical protein VJ183_01510 [Chloroflexia bacterium]|nr:hypothetical protein [Chloroflexia bacterium]
MRVRGLPGPIEVSKRRSTSLGLFSVGRLEGRYTISGEHPDPEGVRSRLDAASQEALHLAVSALTPLWSSTGKGVWLVRRLSVNVDVNMSWDSGDLARCWAMQLARRLANTLYDDGEEISDDVVHFRSHAAYLARFLVDVAAGDAWSRWYYHPFGGLRMLSQSQAIRTALLDNPEVGLEALTLLPTRDIARVLSVVSRNDALRALQGLSRGPSHLDLNHSFDAIQVAWAEWGGALPGDAESEVRVALALYALGCKHNSKLAGPILGRAVSAFARLALRLRIEHSTNGWLAALEGGDMARLYLAVGPQDADVLSPLLAAPAGWVRLMIATMKVEDGSKPDVGAEPAEETTLKATRFGGAFLLMPLLDRLPLADLAKGWPGLDDPNATTDLACLLRFVLLACCLGQERSDALFFDPTLRDMMSIGPALLPADVGKWFSKVGTKRLIKLLDRLRAWWHENGAAGGRRLFLASVPRRVPWRDQPVALLLDATRGMWLSADSLGGNQRRLAARLSTTLVYAQEGATIYTEPALIQSLRSARPDLRLVEMSPSNMSEVEDVGDEVMETLARLDRLPFDLSYLCLPRRWGVPVGARLALAVIAMGVLRDFAWRLPGFARSGLPYLYANFLDTPASLECSADRYLVSLGRPPLNLVLNMTGMARGSVELSWLDRPVALQQE